MSRIVIIQGHPDPAGNHLCNALADAYAKGARQAGHAVEIVEPAKIDFPLLRSQEEWHAGKAGTPESLIPAQESSVAADHFVIVYPLWMGTMPALLKGFLEQVYRPGVALGAGEMVPGALMKGKSARIVVTMGMPAMVYRWFFFAHGLKNLQRNILGFVGIRPIRSTLFGMVEAADENRKTKWFAHMEALGRKGI